jgi:formyl-CoA transferase
VRGQGPGPLEGLRVLDLTVALAGPFCTLLLAGLGAEVIKIEAPGGGDIARWNPPYLGRRGVHFDLPEDDDMSLSMLNRARNKKSVTLDLKSERGRTMFFELARRADVVVENFSEGTAERLGVGYDAVRVVNDRIVYCSISGLGADSPYPELKAMDIIVQALGGIMEMTGFPDGPPVRVGIPLGDLLAPLYAFGGLLAALWHRERTGVGQHLDVSLLDSLASLVAVEHPDVSERLGQPPRSGNVLNRLAPFGVYEARDGYVAIGAAADPWAHGLFEAMGRPDLVDDERFAHRGPRAANADALNAMIEAWTKERSTDEIVEELYEKRRVPAARVRGPHEVLHDPFLAERGAVVPLCHPTLPEAEALRGSGMPLRYSHSSSGFDRPAPALGQHNDEVYGQLLGLGPGELEQLTHDRII